MNIATMNGAPGHTKQSGIALVVGLVFLLVLTILGVTTLRTSSLEQRMAGNLQLKTMTFQETEAHIAQLIADLNAAVTTLSANDACGTNLRDGKTPFNDELIDEAESNACVSFLGSTDPGRLIDTAEGGQTSLLHFAIDSSAKTKKTIGNASVEIQQGIFQRGPRAPSILAE